MDVHNVNPRIAKSGRELIYASNVSIFVVVFVQQMLKHSLMPILAEEVVLSTWIMWPVALLRTD